MILHSKKITKYFLAPAMPLLMATSLFSACYQMGGTTKVPVQEMSQLNKPASSVQQATSPVTVKLLSQYQWKLVGIQKQGEQLAGFESVIRSNASRLNFSEDSYISYTLGCNQSFGAFTLNAGVLEYGGLASTRKACSGLNELETMLASWMNGSQLALQVHDDRSATLLQTKDGNTLTWQGEMTHRARYGEPVRLFWEVAAETVHCVDDLGKDALCLKVRNVNYDEKGIKMGAGAWRTFHGTIQGFKHDPSLRQIIRLNAYNDSKQPNKPLYVFDAAVETEFLKSN